MDDAARPAASRYLLLSDLHLMDVEDHPDGWKAYKRSQYVVDDQLDALVAAFVADGQGAPLTLVLNGDIIDFDLVTAIPEDPPWPVAPHERKYGLEATEAKSSWKMARVLADHPGFVATLARFAAGGHAIVYCYGNHDRELYFEAVREVLIEAVRASAAEQGLSLPQAPIRFEPWFYYVPGELFIEHGQQYDFYCAFRYQLAPVMRRKTGAECHLALPMGNLSNRYLIGNIGYFNPHATDYLLSAVGYVKHWLKYYAFSRRTLVWAWLAGSIASLFYLLRTKKRLRNHPPVGYDLARQEVADRFGLDVETLLRLEKLHHAPITNKWFKVIREYWIDRVLIGVVMTGGTIALALTPVPLWVKLMVPLTCFPLVQFLYEAIAGGSQVEAVEQHLPKYARAVARELRVPVVAFGHTHKAEIVPLGRGQVFVNPGTWAPTWGERDGELAPGGQTYAVITFAGGEVRVRTDSWMPLTLDEELEEEVGEEPLPVPEGP